MCVIDVKSENGALLIIFIIIVLFITTLGISVLTLLVADSRKIELESEQQKAFYAAESGLEYGIKSLLISDKIQNWKEENLNTGGGTICDIEAEMITKHSIRITASGKSVKALKKLSAVINKINSMDIPQYAVYSSGSIKNIVVESSESTSAQKDLICSHALAMPVFDLDQLRLNAHCSNTYFKNNLIISKSFTAPPGSIIFVDGNAVFITCGLWKGSLHFIVKGNVEIRQSFKNNKNRPVTIYQPIAGARFFVTQHKLPTTEKTIIHGGIIANSDINGLYFSQKNVCSLIVYHNPAVIKDFLKHSVNAGPKILLETSWSMLN